MDALVPGRSEWMNAERARAWTGVMALMSVLVVVAQLIETWGGTVADPWGHPLAPDFSSFWTAGRLALSGVAAAAWDPIPHGLAERVLFPGDAGFRSDYYAFFYPPPFLVLLLPFSVLPYGAAAWAWIAVTGAGYLVSLRRLLPPGWATLPALAFPALLVNAEHGQNGALTAALLAAAAVNLDGRPRLGGACLGALAIKPQLALLVVPALAAAGRWRALGWAGLAAAGLCALSWLVLGSEAWESFLLHGPLARAALEDGLVGDAKMASGFAAARLLGAGPASAWVVQAVISAVSLAAVITVARRRPGSLAEMAAVGCGTCLASPFLLDYDLVLASVPLAWMARRVAAGQARRWEKAVAIAAFALPLLARPVATVLSLPLVPVVMLALLGIVVARAGRVADGARPPTGPTG